VENPRVAAKGAHLTRFLTLWEPAYTCIEEGWDLEDLHLLSRNKQNDYHEHVSNPTY